MLIMSYATSPTQRDILLLGALTALGATMERYVRCSYSGKYQSPCLQTFFVAPPASGKADFHLSACSWNLFMTKFANKWTKK